MVDLTKLEIKFRNLDSFRIILGSNDANLKVLNSLYNLDIFTKGEGIFISTKDIEIVELLEKIFEVLIMIASNNVIISERDIIYIASLSEKISKEDIVDIYVNRMFITKTLSGKPIYAKTLNQKEYIKAINRDDLVFAIGPAGTGKTYIAVVNALAKLKKSEVKKIILTRPAVEAGESLGFLPGDLKEKVDPYLRPLYDALYEVLGSNTTINQMKLFLTRLGFNSKMVVTGDITQIDLPKKIDSGMINAVKLLEGVKGISTIKFERIDVIRHPLVQKVLAKYEEYER